MKLAGLLQSHHRHLKAGCLPQNLGDGLLYARNPFFRRVREAALDRGFGFTRADLDGYFGFPLVGLDTVLESRSIPYRDNVAAIERLEAARPGFYTLADLYANRPVPNYVLHEAAHAVAYHESFDRSRPVAETFAEPENLLRVLAGEAFAMTAEYLAACSVTGPLERWFFSINSYRRRTQAKQAVGDAMLELGEASVVWVLLNGFVASNTLRESLKQREVRQLLEHCSLSKSPSLRQLARLTRAVSEAIKMSREFRVDTARLFLCKFGYTRRIERRLALDSLGTVDTDAAYRESLGRLVDVLVTDTALVREVAVVRALEPPTPRGLPASAPQVLGGDWG